MVRGKGASAVIESGKPITREDQIALNKQSQETLLTTSDIQILEEEMNEIQNDMELVKREPGSSRAQAIDMNAKGKRLDQIKTILETRTPIEVKGRTKDSLVKEEQELEDLISQGMPTRYEMDHPARCPGAVRKHMKWDERNKVRIHRYVEIQKMLRPDEPKSIEALRQEK